MCRAPWRCGLALLRQRQQDIPPSLYEGPPPQAAGSGRGCSSQIAVPQQCNSDIPVMEELTRGLRFTKDRGDYSNTGRERTAEGALGSKRAGCSLAEGFVAKKTFGWWCNVVEFCHLAHGPASAPLTHRDPCTNPPSHHQSRRRSLPTASD
jgi:hypothetical protein